MQYPAAPRAPEEGSTPDSVQPSIDPAALALAQKRLALLARFKNGVNWFYWIAGLSILNTAIYLFGGKITFVIGLAATQIVDGFFTGIVRSLPDSSSGMALVVRGVGVVLDLAVAALFFLCGYLGLKQRKGWIIAGMILYFALFSLFGGLRALGEYQKLFPPAQVSPYQQPPVISELR
jgi:hypothetical protein